jgi:hypothetical protein
MIAKCNSWHTGHKPKRTPYKRHLWQSAQIFGRMLNTPCYCRCLAGRRNSWTDTDYAMLLQVFGRPLKFLDGYWLHHVIAGVWQTVESWTDTDYAMLLQVFGRPRKFLDGYWLYPVIAGVWQTAEIPGRILITLSQRNLWQTAEFPGRVLITNSQRNLWQIAEFPGRILIKPYYCRCLADRTNAWTDTDHTCYTVYTAGSSGILNIFKLKHTADW